MSLRNEMYVMLPLTFFQALSQSGFALHVWSLFSHFCQSVPCLHKTILWYDPKLMIFLG
jgi:hypothetical protein